jgi:hypothetical protein
MIASIYDPQVEFLEIGVSVNGVKADPKGSGLYFFNFFRYSQTHRLTELTTGNQ